MSGRRGQSLPPQMFNEKPSRGRCITAICVSWKVITCIVSHVTLVLLVVSYCVGGAFLFKHLEEPHELEIKKGIQNMRQNLTDKIWKFSDNASVLSENDWIASVTTDLASFENQILTAMKKEGWDGDEDINKSQWTFAGSLFYSIIVITTIGYGHISPRTDWGKVTTIFYAIVGIPLMLLCLSNIGDVMATSFRFLYWRVCCFVCTRTSRRPRNRSRQRSMRGQRYVSRSQPPPFRRSMNLTQRSAADSGVGNSIGLPHAYSDPELRTVGRSDYNRDYDYRHEGQRAMGGNHKRHQHMSSVGKRGDKHDISYDGNNQHDEALNYTQTLNRGARYSNRQRYRERMQDRHTVEREHQLGRSNKFDSMEELNALSPSVKRTLSVRSVRTPNLRHDEINREASVTREPRDFNLMQSPIIKRGRSVPNAARGRAKSVDPRVSAAHYEEVDEEVVRKTPIISNRYAIDELDHPHSRPKGTMRSHSMPRSALHKNLCKNNIGPTYGVGQHHRRPSLNRKCSSPNSRYGNYLELPAFTSPQTKRGHSPRYEENEADFDEYYYDEHDGADVYNNRSPNQSRRRDKKLQRRERTERLPPSPRIMSPMGFAVKRQVRRRPSYEYEEDSIYGDELNDIYGDISPKDRPVPIWLCVFLVISYILGGAALFANWEQWSFLDSAYFCFITLTTIGFGDFVPAKGVQDESEQSIAYCSLYLLFGIALLAMSFNLVQEEFIANVKEVARRLGILKDEEDND